MKPKYSLKKILNLVIFIVCASIVANETYGCLTKYLSQPQGTHISVDKGIGHVFPQFTICPSVNYARTKIFKECGLEWTKFYFGEIHETRWWPNDTAKCGTTENLMNHLFYDINDVIKHAEVLYEDSEKVDYYPNQTDFWSIHQEFRVGRCFIFSIIQDQKITKITFNFKDGGGLLNVYFHSPGLFKTVGLMNRKSIDVQTNFPRSESVEIVVDYEVYKMLDFGGAECNNDPEYNRDHCTDDQLYQESMNDLNCTWPFLDFDRGAPSWNEICQNETLIERLSEDIAPKYVQKKGSQCLDPCQYVKIDASETARTSFNPNPKIIFHFAETVNVLTAYYDYTGLSLVAEIGGYVGLFLGISFYQFTDVISYIFNRYF